MRGFLLLTTAILAGPPLLDGCASSHEVTKERVTFQVPTWTGRSAEEVIMVLGRPARRESTADGGTLLVYEEIGEVFPAPGNHSSLPVVEGAGAERDWRAESYHHKLRENARFWLDASGTVLRYWFSDRLYKKGIPAPPIRDN